MIDLCNIIMIQIRTSAFARIYILYIYLKFDEGLGRKIYLT